MNRPQIPLTLSFALIATLLTAVSLLSAPPASAAPGVHPGGGWVDLAAGDNHSCALSARGEVVCWGGGGSGQLGTGSLDDVGDQPNEMGSNLTPIDLGPDREATAISAGNFHTCALLDTAQVKCWGFNISGQLGYGDTMDRGDDPDEMGNNLPPIDLGTGRSATAIAAGAGHSCALLDNGSVKCWGAGTHGRLGQDDFATRGDDPNEMGDDLPAIDVGAGRTATAITAGGRHTCALLDNDELKCWGDNAYGQLGLGDTNDRGVAGGQMGDNLPAVDLGSGRSAVAVSAGLWHTCAVLDNATLKCWGRSQHGQLGRGDTSSRGDGPNEMGDNLFRVPVGTDRTVVAVTTGDNHTCVRLDDRSAKCFGENLYGQLGLGDTDDRGDNGGEMQDNLPPVDLGGVMTAVSAGRYHNCAALENNTVRCWGRNHFGQLGLGDLFARGDQPEDALPAMPPVDLGTNRLLDPAGIVNVNPGRILETRPGESTVDGQQQGIGRRTPGEVTVVDVAGRAGIDIDTEAALITLTAIDPAMQGHATAYPCDAPKPGSSTLNYAAGQTVANSATIRLAVDGTLCIYTQRSADYVVDVNGFIPFGSTVDTVTPARLLETRPEEPTVDGVQQGVGRRSAGQVTTVVVAGRAGVPDDAVAAIVNIAAVAPADRGYAVAYSCGGPIPTASTLNFSAGQTVANGATVPIGAGGTVCVYTHRDMDLVFDVTGYHVAGASPESFVPMRFLETRPTETTFDGQYQGIGRREPGEVTEVQITGRFGIPESTPAVMVNVASIMPIGPGFVRLFPCDEPQPGTSMLNFGDLQTIANNATIKLSAEGTICVYTHRQMDMILDVTGITR